MRKISTSYTIETKRLLLRIPHSDDIPFVFSATRYKGFNDGMLWDPPNNEEELIIPHNNAVQAWNDGSAYSFTIIDRIENALVGRISIRKELQDGTWNLGFWIHPEKQNKGYVTEAAKAVIEFGFDTLNAEKIVACYALWNKKSERVLTKVGMIFSRYIEKGYLKNDEWVNENLLEIKKTDWK